MSTKSDLRVHVVGGKLTISIGIERLAEAFNQSEYARPFDEDACEYVQRVQVLDPKLFAEDVAAVLLKEDEEGTTAVHLLLDKACEAAAEDGSQAVEGD